MTSGAENTIERLPETPWRHLQAFLAGADRGAPALEDWRRYYEFVKACHMHGAELPVEDLVTHLRESGFTPDATIELGLVYVHGRAMLASRG